MLEVCTNSSVEEFACSEITRLETKHKKFKPCIAQVCFQKMSSWDLQKGLVHAAFKT